MSLLVKTLPKSNARVLTLESFFKGIEGTSMKSHGCQVFWESDATSVLLINPSTLGCDRSASCANCFR
jgi:hypothetical protein